MSCFGRSLAALGWLGLVLAQAGGISGVWHYIDIANILCPGKPGYATVTIAQPASVSNAPTVFTVFRTTMNPVSISFVAKDAAGRTVVDQSTPIMLQSVTSRSRRRLQESEDADPSRVLEAPTRGLMSRRRSSSSSLRRRSFTDSRRRAITDSRRRTAPVDSPRRRTAMLSPRRRTAMLSPRRRAMLSPRRRLIDSRRRSADHSSRRRSNFVPSYTYSNPLSPRIGQYGYANPTSAYHNYGGHMPISTSYGYTGANAYTSGSGMKIALAGGAGLLAGYAASNLFHSSGNNFGGYTHQQMMSAPCTSGSWTGTCNSCLSQYGANRCDVTLSPNFDATRDDLMNTGFIPAQVSWPITVTILTVNGNTGNDFNPMMICPPTVPGIAWSPPANMPRLFLTTTTLATQPVGPGYDQYNPGYGSNYGSSYQSSGGGFFAWFFSVLSCCCCCGLCLGCYTMSKKGGKMMGFSGSVTDSESESVSMVHQDAYNPYWNGQAHVQSSLPFMDTPAPGGVSWASYCRGDPEVSPRTGYVGGRWGDCLAWAVLYEHQNPDWEHNPAYQGMGPAGSVINAMLQKASDSDAEAVEEAANKLESDCRRAIASDSTLPIINRRV